MNNASSLADWTPDQIALGKRWVKTWRLAARDLERLRRRDIRERDNYQAILLLCSSADYTVPPHSPKLWSGLVEQQQWFKKAMGCE
ncbi:MAG TPA: hypothetical protein VJU84_10645 [Pyrinomonadaceae bacterium]|nr:hypothetical protein [Pyrinomonadaceae bacterium]